MRVVVFGASGATGRLLVAGALRRGDVATAFVRDPATFDAPAGARVVSGDVVDLAAVRTALADQDAVLSALGARTLAPNSMLAEASANIVNAMQAAGIRRLIVLGAAGSLRDCEKYQSAGTRFAFAVFKATLLRFPMRAQAVQQQTIEASALDYTIVLPPRLTDGPRRGAYRVERDGLPADGRLLSRADLADFMLAQLDDRTFVRAAPHIAY